jgi:hypothetical protein
VKGERERGRGEAYLVWTLVGIEHSEGRGGGGSCRREEGQRHWEKGEKGGGKDGPSLAAQV